MPKQKAKSEGGQRSLLLPTVDTIFKKLFGDERNKDILADFLAAVLGFEIKPRDIILIDPHLKREEPDDKLGILDVKLRLKGGKVVNIEVQVDNFKGIRHRQEYYISKMSAEQLGVKEEHQNLLPVVSILIINDYLLTETERYHCKFSMLEETEHFKLHDLRTIHTLELPKLPMDSHGKLENWLKFLKSKTREEFMSVAVKSRPMTRALEELEVMSADEATRMIYDYRLKMARDERARLKDATEKGMEQGLTQGLVQGRKEGLLQAVKAMKNEKMDIETIARITGFTVDEVLRL
ncbi:MAG: Rpn family recombination-promoting nuclease/putative transposase [Chitinispirillales bacterium]|nr:Rpn family recombination-promoting nuclease/putative transposase [Chitinispirillales bacterium]